MVTSLSSVYHGEVSVVGYFLCHLWPHLHVYLQYNPYLPSLCLQTISFFVSGWTKGSLSLDASVEHDGYFSAEEQVTSDPEEEKEDKMVRD